MVLRRGSNRSADWDEATSSLRSYDSVLSELVDPIRTPELLAVRGQVRSWRFYDLVKELGETQISGLGSLEGPPWNWGHR